jgi:hypothetical protein
MFRSSPFACLFLLLACVGLPRAMVPPGSGPPLFVTPDSTCRTDPLARSAPATVPDKQLCHDLVTALERSLNEVGYRVVGRPDEPHAANVHLYAEQSSLVEHDGTVNTVITVQAVVDSIGQEVDRAVEDGSVQELFKQRDQVVSIVDALANALAHSPRMRRAGLTPGL